MSKKIRDSFIFYRSFYQSAKKLPKEDKAELFDAICSYALDGEMSEMSVMPEAIFTVIKPNLDANRRRWENGCKDKKKTEELEANDKQDGSKTEANDKQTGSRTEGNKDKDVNVDKDVKSESKSELESQFESFWQSYKAIHTGKGGKEEAKKSFLKALKESTFEEIAQGLHSYMTDCHSKNIYTKQVVVWLNKKGWKDEYTTAKEEPKSDFAKWKEQNR